MRNHCKLFLRLNKPYDYKWKTKPYVLSSVILSQRSSHYDHHSFKSNHPKINYCYGLIGFIGISSYFLKRKKIFAESVVENELTAGQEIDNLPFYSLKEIETHNSKEKRIWVIYKAGVYDVTDFVEEHPGGNKILLAAGSSVEPFWLLYGVHNTPEVHKMIEKYRIGNLDVEDLKQSESLSVEDPYAKDPKRHPALKPASVKPYNAEPPPVLLADSFYTPNAIFYVRNHLPVPEVDADSYKLKIEGIGIQNKLLSLETIKKFPKYTVSATIQCAGNRRSEMTEVKPVKGLSWGHAAIANATWSGARLIDVLKYCGFYDQSQIEHVQFEGLDKGPDGTVYGASIPAEKAFDPKGDVILAYEMNGEPLPRDHGYPLRVVVPGVVGARNVKWVGKIVLSEKESDSHWQQNDYKGFSPSTDWDTVDFTSSPAIQELPVISAICSPENGENVELVDGMLVVKGYAWSGGGKNIVRVDVSADQGKTWHVADLDQLKDKPPRHWAWTLWTVVIPIESQNNKVELWAKAVDSSYNTQPESFENIWNLRGVLSNAYHRVKVNVKS